MQSLRLLILVLACVQNESDAGNDRNDSSQTEGKTDVAKPDCGQAQASYADKQQNDTNYHATHLPPDIIPGKIAGGYSAFWVKKLPPPGFFLHVL